MIGFFVTCSRSWFETFFKGLLGRGSDRHMFQMGGSTTNLWNHLWEEFCWLTFLLGWILFFWLKFVVLYLDVFFIFRWFFLRILHHRIHHHPSCTTIWPGYSLETNIFLARTRIFAMPERWIPAWNPKQPFINGCFSWMIPNLYIENGCFTKHPFKKMVVWGSRWILVTVNYRMRKKSENFRIFPKIPWINGIHWNYLTGRMQQDSSIFSRESL